MYCHIRTQIRQFIITMKLHVAPLANPQNEIHLAQINYSICFSLLSSPQLLGRSHRIKDMEKDRCKSEWVSEEREWNFWFVLSKKWLEQCHIFMSDINVVLILILICIYICEFILLRFVMIALAIWSSIYGWRVWH